MKGLSRKKNTNRNFISKIEEVKSGWDEDADERGVS